MNPLTTVQNLYLLQFELCKVLDSDLSDPDKVKEARKQVREFSQLLEEADWRYMGGEDVMESLEEIKEEASVKISKAKGSARKRVRK